MIAKRIRYRVAQFWRTLRAPWWPVDVAYARARLEPELLTLFQRMARAEQQHGIALCQALEERGVTDTDLRVAAVLHDCGKTVAPPTLWDRVLVVLGEWLLPRQAARWAATDTARGLTRGFVIRRRHAEWGAALAQEAGASERAVALIREHHNPADSAKALEASLGADFGTLLRTLQDLDDA